MKNLNELNFGFAGAIISAICMLLLGILGIWNVGIYTGAVNMMQNTHMFFSLSVGGIILGMIEVAIIGFVSLYLFALIYNKLEDRK